MTSLTPARIAVLTIGDELLTGEVADTNLGYIGAALSATGLRVAEHSTVCDEEGAIAGALSNLLRRNDAVVVTGGLGPTSDDVTREAIALAAGVDLERREDLELMIRSFFRSMGREMPEENVRQAYIPRGATDIPPAGGTAPGFMLEHEGKLVVALPGVPHEMRQMFGSVVAGELQRRFKSGEVSLTGRVLTFGAGESDVAHQLQELIEKSPVSYGFLAQSGRIVVKLTAVAGSPAEAKRLVAKEKERVEELLGSLVYGFDDETMEDVMGTVLRERGLTLAVAESLTAGMVCSRIANVPGSSDFFRGGVVTYSKESKKEILGLNRELLEDGAVTQPVARAMAESVRRRFAADLGVATSGVAGPGDGGERKPVGTLCLALAHGEGVESWERRLPGDRELVRSIATMAAMNVVRLHLL